MKQNLMRYGPEDERADSSFGQIDRTIVEGVTRHVEASVVIGSPHQTAMTKFRPSTVTAKGNLINRRPGRTTLGRSRPLSGIREVLSMAGAFVVPAVLEMLVILYFVGILE